MNKLVNILHETKGLVSLIPIGLLLIVFGILSFISVERTKDYIKTEAVVTKASLYEDAYTDADGNHYDATYTVYVKYTVDGDEYNREYGIFSNYKEGDKVTIAYNPENPNEIVQPNGVVLPIIFLGLGIISLIVGVIKLIKALNKRPEEAL